MKQARNRSMIPVDQILCSTLLVREFGLFAIVATIRRAYYATATGCSGI